MEDKGEGVKIEWTVYGKIRRVTSRTGTVLTYRYDASGNRVEKQLLQGGITTTTRYVRDASGNVMATYQASTTAAGATAGEVLFEQSLYGSGRLGLYKGGRLGGQRRLGNKQYELSNHLGNVLAVVSDNIYLDATSTWTKTLTTNDYYPFGLTMPGRSYSSDSYRYGFNGKEKDSEFLNNYDYGFRIYNSRIGKFLSEDPLTKGYPMLTPYQFASNSPIMGIDQDGLEFAWAQEVWDATKSGYNTTVRVVDETYTAYLPYLNAAGRGLKTVGDNLAPFRLATPEESKQLQEDGGYIENWKKAPGRTWGGIKSLPGNLKKLPGDLKKVYTEGSLEQQIETTVGLVGNIAAMAKGKAPANTGRVALAGFITDNAITFAVSNVSRLQHAFKHAKDVTQFAGKTWNKTVMQEWRQFNEDVLKTATKTFDNVLGQDKVKGYYKQVDGQNIATYVYAEGAKAGEIATTVVLNANQMTKFDLN